MTLRMMRVGLLVLLVCAASIVRRQELLPVVWKPTNAAEDACHCDAVRNRRLQRHAHRKSQTVTELAEGVFTKLDHYRTIE